MDEALIRADRDKLMQDMRDDHARSLKDKTLMYDRANRLLADMADRAITSAEDSLADERKARAYDNTLAGTRMINMMDQLDRKSVV